MYALENVFVLLKPRQEILHYSFRFVYLRLFTSNFINVFRDSK